MLPNPRLRRWSGAVIAAPHLETVYGYACAQKLAPFCAIFVAKCLTLPVLGIEVTQSAGAAHRYPGLFDINGKKLANAQFKQWLVDSHLHVVINYRFSNGQFFEERTRSFGSRYRLDFGVASLL